MEHLCDRSVIKAAVTEFDIEYVEDAIGEAWNQIVWNTALRPHEIERFREWSQKAIQ